VGVLITIWQQVQMQKGEQLSKWKWECSPVGAVTNS